MSLITTEMLKTNYDPKISMPMSQYVKAIETTRNEIINEVLEIVDDADKKAGDKTYIVLDDGRFYSQAKYIKEKMLELLG